MPRTVTACGGGLAGRGPDVDTRPRLFRDHVRTAAAGDDADVDADAARQVLESLDRGNLLLNRDALLQVDKLLHDFFLPQHRNARYA